MGWLSIFSFLGCGNTPKTEIKTVLHGPFTIQMETHHSKYFNMNVGRRVTHSVLRYKILHNGKPIDFPEALQTNTGFPHLWRVYILEGATTPTLLAGSQSLYLISEKDGQASVSPLFVQGYDFASLQMLDAEDGQPGERKEVYMGDPEDSVDTIGGGDYLLVSDHAVLHIPDMRLFVFNKNNETIDDYYFMGAHRGAVAFSPDKKWIVYDGNITNWDNEKNKVVSQYALIVYDFRADKGYALPFNQTDTRLRDAHSITREWLNTYFEWKTTAEGEYRLHLRHFERLPFWQGYFRDNEDVYALVPVSLDMQQVLVDFVLNQLHLTKEHLLPGNEYSSHEINIAYGDLKLSLWYRPEDAELLLMKNVYAPDNEQYKTLIHQLGTAFNAELAKGKYQEEFTRY